MHANYLPMSLNVPADANFVPWYGAQFELSRSQYRRHGAEPLQTPITSNPTIHRQSSPFSTLNHRISIAPQLQSPVEATENRILLHLKDSGTTTETTAAMLIKYSQAPPPRRDNITNGP